MKTQQGIKNFTQAEATKIAGEDPDYMIRDMFEAIERKDYPSWDVFVQVMDPSEAENYRWNIFDMTKVWPHKDLPLRKIGKMTLNRNVRYMIPLGLFRQADHFSPEIILPILSRRPSLHLLWYLGLPLPLIPVSHIPTASSATS